MNDAIHSTAIRVGEFRFDRRAQRLWRDDTPVNLVPQVWTLLCLLVDRAGQLVSKEEILAGAWSGVAVSDAALSQAVRRLRHAFGDDARRPRYVETVHRRGFRLIAPVRDEVVDAVAKPPVVSDETSLFVGRAVELGRLSELQAAVQKGRRQVVFIEGEAGIGKTALLRAFLAGVTDGRVRIAAAHGVEQQGTAEPYMPVLEALERLARSDAEALHVLRRYAPSWLIQMPWLLESEEIRRLEGAGTDTTRARMLREMARALEVLSTEHPLILVLEDLHWADKATVDLLTSIARRPDAARLMIVGTYRPVESIAYDHPIVGCVRSLWTSSACTRLSLESLAPTEVEAYLSQRFGADVAAALTDCLHVRTEGNPLFLVAVVDHLIEHGFLAMRGGRWSLTRPVEAVDLRHIPNSVREMIELQLASLDAGELEVLQAASVAAIEFRSASVAAALAAAGPGDQEAVERACKRLMERRRLLRSAGSQVWPDGTRTESYSFRHDLYRQVLYDRLPTSQRCRWHQRIGERIEQAFGGDPIRIAAELVMHFSRSGDDARAVNYALLAAEQARRRYAIREAAVHLGDALRHLEHLPPGADRDLKELQLRTNLLLARTYTQLDQSEADEYNFARVRALADLPSAGRDVFHVQHMLAHIYYLRSLPNLAAPIVERLPALAHPDLPSEQMEAAGAMSGVYMMLGRFEAGAEAAARAVDLFGAGDEPACAKFPGFETKWREVGATQHTQLSAALFHRGSLDQAVTHLQQALAYCARRVRPFWAAGCIMRGAGILCLRGDLAWAQELSDRGLAIAEENGIEHQVRGAAPQRVWLAIMSGERRQARDLIRSAWDDYCLSQPFISAPIGPLFLLDACRIARAADDGLAIAEEVWAATRESGVAWYDPELQRLQGELWLVGRKRGALQKAETCFVHALESAREQGNRFYELRAATSWARLRRHLGDAHPARAALTKAYAGFTEGLSTPDLQAARELLHPDTGIRPARDASQRSSAP